MAASVGAGRGGVKKRTDHRASVFAPGSGDRPRMPMRPVPGGDAFMCYRMRASGAAYARSARMRLNGKQESAVACCTRPTCAVPANGKRPADSMSAHALRCHFRPSADGKAKRMRPSARIPAGCKGANVTVASRRFRGGRIRAPTHGATASNGFATALQTAKQPLAAVHAMWHCMTRLHYALAGAAPCTTAPRAANLRALFLAPRCPTHHGGAR